MSQCINEKYKGKYIVCNDNEEGETVLVCLYVCNIPNWKPCLMKRNYMILKTIEGKYVEGKWH